MRRGRGAGGVSVKEEVERTLGSQHGEQNTQPLPIKRQQWMFHQNIKSAVFFPALLPILHHIGRF